MARNERFGALAALVLALTAPAGAAETAANGQLSDVVIKAQEKDEPSAGKPAFDVPYDPYETLRASLKPDESLLLAQSPGVARWVGGTPRLLKDGGLIQPWNDALTSLSRLRLPVPADLETGVPGKAADRRWSLTLADEDGKPVRTFEGKGDAPAAVESTSRRLGRLHPRRTRVLGRLPLLGRRHRRLDGAHDPRPSAALPGPPARKRRRPDDRARHFRALRRGPARPDRRQRGSEPAEGGRRLRAPAGVRGASHAAPVRARRADGRGPSRGGENGAGRRAPHSRRPHRRGNGDRRRLRSAPGAARQRPLISAAGIDRAAAGLPAAAACGLAAASSSTGAAAPTDRTSAR